MFALKLPAENIGSGDHVRLLTRTPMPSYGRWRQVRDAKLVPLIYAGTNGGAAKDVIVITGDGWYWMVEPRKILDVVLGPQSKKHRRRRFLRR